MSVRSLAALAAVMLAAIVGKLAGSEMEPLLVRYAQIRIIEQVFPVPREDPAQSRLEEDFAKLKKLCEADG